MVPRAESSALFMAHTPERKRRAVSPLAHEVCEIAASSGGATATPDSGSTDQTDRSQEQGWLGKRREVQEDRAAGVAGEARRARNDVRIEAKLCGIVNEQSGLVAGPR